MHLEYLLLQNKYTGPGKLVHNTKGGRNTSQESKHHQQLNLLELNLLEPLHRLRTSRGQCTSKVEVAEVAMGAADRTGRGRGTDTSLLSH